MAEVTISSGVEPSLSNSVNSSEGLSFCSCIGVRGVEMQMFVFPGLPIPTAGFC
jgi:hypothetical protein